MLVTVEDIKVRGRWVSPHLDAGRVAPLIRESELTDVRLAIGDELYLDLDVYVNSNRTPANDTFNNLLDGCTWEKNGKKRLMVGLVEILCYLTQGRLVQSGDLAVTRSGNKFKLDANSETPELKERIAYYKELYCIAQEYLKGVVEYVNFNFNGTCKQKGEIYARSVVIRALGD